MKWTAISSRFPLSAALTALAVTACGSVMLLGTKSFACDAHASTVTPQPQAAAAAVPAPQPTTTAMDAGMRAYIDPDTGLLTSIRPEGLPAEVEADKQPEPELFEVRLPDGSYMMDLKGTHQEYVTIQLDPNGNKVVQCVQDPKAALPAPAPAPQREDR